MANKAERPYAAPDVIVVGSGFGGAIVASRLVDAGKSVVVLERGPWRDTLPAREAGISQRKPLPRTGSPFSVVRSIHPPLGPKRGLTLNKSGFLDMWIGSGIKAVCTSGVGGGSHAWAGLMVKSPDGFWDDRATSLSDEVLAPHFLRVASELKGNHPEKPDEVPNYTSHAWENEEFFTPLAPGEQPEAGVLFPSEDGGLNIQVDDNGIKRKPMDYTRDHGMFGSPDGAKSTVDALFLLPAVKKGLDLRDMHEVLLISSNSSGGYEVKVRDLRAKKTMTLTAPKLVLAAGTMNTISLLLQSRAAGGISGLPALGKGFGANGDLIAEWPVPENPLRDSSLGPPVHGRIKIKDHGNSCYVILAGGETPPVPSFMKAKARKKAGKAYSVIAMSQDAANGSVRIEKGRVKFAFDLAGSASYGATMTALDALAKYSGRPVTFDRKSVMTAHPMGGCRIADKIDEGVVNGEGFAAWNARFFRIPKIHEL